MSGEQFARMFLKNRFSETMSQTWSLKSCDGQGSALLPVFASPATRQLVN